MDTQIGRFQIEEEIGRGGMGIVYRAYDPVLDRPIALKLLAPHLGDNPNALLRFHREAAHVSSLKHANIALVYDYGEHEGQPYIAMEWVEGRTLKALLQAEGPLSLDRSLRIFDQLASALDYAHQHGVIHRDLKPANIIVDEHDNPTIVDFGLAWLEDAPSLTMTGSVLGTPLYMAPEQIAGEAVDGRADLYSLAVILYEMLAGRTPFGGDEAGTPVVIQQQLYAPPPPVSEFNPTLPDHVEQALNVALSKQPGDRFATAALFSRALHEPERARASTPAKGRKQRKRRWLWALVILALLFVAFLVLVEWDAVRGLLAGDGSDGEPYTGPYYTTWLMSNGGPDQARLVETDFYPLADSARWEQEAEYGYSTPPVAASGRIFIADGDQVRAFDWASGEEVWEPPQLGADISTPLALFDDEETFMLLVATDDQQLYALNGYDAGLAWRISGDELEGPIAGGLTVADNGRIYVATDTGRVHAIDPYSSEIEFTFLREESEFIFPPAATNAAIYLVDSDGLLLALDPASPQVAWTAEIGGYPVAPALIGEAWGHVVTVADDEGRARVRAFSALTGDLVWEVVLDEPVTGLAADWWHVYATTELGSLYAYDGESGVLDWSVDLGDEPALPPLTNSEQVVVSTASGRVQTFSAESGEPAPGPDLTLDAPLAHPPITVGGWLYVQTDEVVAGIGP